MFLKWPKFILLTKLLFAKLILGSLQKIRFLKEKVSNSRPHRPKFLVGPRAGNRNWNKFRTFQLDMYISWLCTLTVLLCLCICICLLSCFYNSQLLATFGNFCNVLYLSSLYDRRNSPLFIWVVLHGPAKIYEAVEVIWIFLAYGRDGWTDIEGIPRGPRGSKK